MARIIVAVFLSILFIPLAHAEKRVALVVGNSAYQHTPALINPRNDATDMAAALKKQGFQVIEGFDLDKAAFDHKIQDFANALEDATAGVLFYAGHGLQVAGQNYLVPVDAKLGNAVALDFEMVRLDVIQRAMERQTTTNILFLDACRDNPLARNLARTMGTRSTDIGQGLAAVESGVGTLISFSTQPGNVALDGAGRNSPFAGALLKQLGASADDLSAILIAVRNDVMKETMRKQVPWEHSALTGRFYFHPSAAQPATSTSPPPVAPQPQFSEAERAWAAAQSTKSAAVLEAFIERYKDSFYADLARERMADLKKPQVAVIPPPPRPNPKKEVDESSPAAAQEGFTRRSWLGVRIQNVDEEIANSLALREARGAIVVRPVTGSPAADAGVFNADIILAINGNKIADTGDLVRQTSNYAPGTKIDLKIWRQQRERNVPVQLARYPSRPAAPPAAARAPEKPEDYTYAGKVVSSHRTEDLGLTLQLWQSPNNDRFVTLAGISANSSAAAKGLLSGDELRRINRVRVTGFDVVSREIENARRAGRSAVLLRINRRGVEKFVGVRLAGR